MATSRRPGTHSGVAMLMLARLSQLLTDLMFNALLVVAQTVGTAWYCDHCDRFHLLSTERWFVRLRVDGWMVTTRALSESPSCCWRGVRALRRGAWTPETTDFDVKLAKVIGPSVR